MDYKVRGVLHAEIRGAMETDPDGVRRWFDGLQDEKWRETVLEAYLPALGEQNPEQMLDFREKLPNDLKAKCIKAMVKGVFAGGDNNTLQEWMDNKVMTHAKADWLPQAFSEVMGTMHMHRYASPDIAAFIEKHVGAPYVDYRNVEWIAEGYMDREPLAAMEWAQRMRKADPSSLPEGIFERMLSQAKPADRPQVQVWMERNLPPANQN